jgi:tRNA(Ile)-lysidine synthase TilS/MesJ
MCDTNNNPFSARTAFHDTSNCETILDETFVNAEKILCTAKADQRSIVEASKMSDADLMLGNDDGKLEELRWYVYPKEVAELLLKGIEALDPLEQKNSTLLGALQPSSISPLPPNDRNSNDRKRKSHFGNSDVADDTLHFVSTNSATTTVLFLFRDGENHSGEATLEEIGNSVEVGDLSSACEIFHPTTKEWTLLKGFDIESMPSLSHFNKPSHLKPANDIVVDATSICGQQKKGMRTTFNWGTRFDMPHNISHASVQGQNDGIKSGDTSLAPDSGTASSPTYAPSIPKKQKFRHVKPPAKLMRTATQAIVQWNMINDGDRLLLGLSGGKDSLSLLHLLLEFQRVRPIKFELEVCTIDPMTPSFDPSPLIPYVESLGLKYHYIKDDIVSRANNAGKSGKMVSSLCAFCARMKRGNLYSCARRNNCNKLVLAQHLDDCAESMMMSMMHNGVLRTMKANYAIDAGDLSVIRPLIYCREGLMTTFAKDANLPVINENCPACFEEPKERARIKKMLSREETLYPNFYDNIRRSLIPLMHDDMAPILRAFTEETLSRSRKIPWKEKNKSLNMPSQPVSAESANSESAFSLTHISDDELVLELARRKASKYLTTAKNTEQAESTIPDLTGQVCTLNGGNGSIPCYELME